MAFKWSDHHPNLQHAIGEMSESLRHLSIFKMYETLRALTQIYIMPPLNHLSQIFPSFKTCQWQILFLYSQKSNHYHFEWANIKWNSDEHSRCRKLSLLKWENKNPIIYFTALPEKFCILYNSFCLVFWQSSKINFENLLQL